MSEIRIYVEGGRPGSEALMRKAFNEFLKGPLDQARLKRIHWQVIPGHGREQTYRRFCNALIDHPDAVNILLVDSEEAVLEFGKTWKHLRMRDKWDDRGIADAQCHLMVCTMESWFVADREILAAHFRKSVDAVPAYSNVESVEKKKIEQCMKTVSRGLNDRTYHKITDGTRLLSKIRPGVVMKAAPHCKLLFDALETTIAGMP